MLAQLRDVLAAEDSSIVAKEYDHGGTVSPERTKLDLLPVDIRQHNIGKPRTVGHWQGTFYKRTV